MIKELSSDIQDYEVHRSYLDEVYSYLDSQFDNLRLECDELAYYGKYSMVDIDCMTPNDRRFYMRSVKTRLEETSEDLGLLSLFL